MATSQLVNSLHPKSHQLQISPHKTRKCQHVITSKVCENQVTDHQRIITLTFNQLWQSLSKKYEENLLLKTKKKLRAIFNYNKIRGSPMFPTYPRADNLVVYTHARYG